MKMSVGVSGNVPRLSISTILNDKLHLEYFREFLNFKDQRLITLHRGTIQNLEIIMICNFKYRLESNADLSSLGVKMTHDDLLN